MTYQPCKFCTYFLEYTTKYLQWELYSQNLISYSTSSLENLVSHQGTLLHVQLINVMTFQSSSLGFFILLSCLPTLRKCCVEVRFWNLKRHIFENYVSPSTPMSDQNRISPYYIYTISSRQGMRIKKNIIMGLLIDPIPNSPK